MTRQQSSGYTPNRLSRHQYAKGAQPSKESHTLEDYLKAWDEDEGRAAKRERRSLFGLTRDAINAYDRITGAERYRDRLEQE